MGREMRNVMRTGAITKMRTQSFLSKKRLFFCVGHHHQYSLLIRTEWSFFGTPFVFPFRDVVVKLYIASFFAFAREKDMTTSSGLQGILWSDTRVIREKLCDWNSLGSISLY
jgi:hypothetical protein